MEQGLSRLPLPPVACGQPQGERPGLLLLQLHQPPGLDAGIGSRPWAKQALQGLITALAGLAAGRSPLGLRLLKHLRDRGPGEDVVELLEQQRTPVGRRCRR